MFKLYIISMLSALFLLAQACGGEDAEQACYKYKLKMEDISRDHQDLVRGRFKSKGDLQALKMKAERTCNFLKEGDGKKCKFGGKLDGTAEDIKTRTLNLKNGIQECDAFLQAIDSELNKLP